MVSGHGLAGGAIINAIGGASGGGDGWASQALAHAQARLAADQVAKCAPCTLKEDQKAVDAAQGLVAAGTNSARQSGRLLDIQV